MQLTSQIDQVKLYAAGATVSRVAEFPVTETKVEIPGLPLALDDSTVRVRVESDSGNSAIATDLRIGLAVPPQTQTLPFPDEAAIQIAQTEVKQLEELLTLINHEIKVISKIEIPTRSNGDGEKAPPPSPTTMRMAIAHYKNKQIRERQKEKRNILEKLRHAQEHLDDLLQKKARASSAKEARPNELRKIAIIRLSYQAIETTNQPSQQRLILEYFIPGARWTPTYVCRLDTVANTATIAMRALICQQSGENWSGVALELSTAQPMMWCELPELPSLRLGRAQPTPKKSGWRLPPIGAELLFEDYDRDRQKQPLFNEQEEEEGSIEQLLDDILQSLNSDSDDDVGGLYSRLFDDKSNDDLFRDLDMLFEDSVSIQDRDNHPSPPPARNYASQRRALVVQSNFSPFGNKLVQYGYVDNNQMKQALKQSRQLKKPLPEVIEDITNRKLSPQWLRLYKRQQLFELKLIYAIKSFDLESAEITTEQIINLIENIIPIETCRLHRILPLYKTKTNPPALVVGMIDPDKLDAQDDLNRILKPQGMKFLRRVIAPEDYEHFLNQYLEEKAARKKLEREQANQVDLSIDPNAFGDVDLQEADAEDNEDHDLCMSLQGAESAPIVRTANQILAKALTDGASEIHIEPQEDHLRVRMRKDGVLKEVYKLPSKVVNPLVARFKIIADLDIVQRRQIQEGQFQRKFQGNTIYFAIFCFHTQFGAKLVIQILNNFDHRKYPINLNKQLSPITAYHLMEIGATDQREKRGKLSIRQQEKTYLEILKRQDIEVKFNVMSVVQEAISQAQQCLNQPLPFGGINVREVAVSFDYAYHADGRVDVPSDGEFHSVALTVKNTKMGMDYVTVPREENNVFRIAKLLNPLPSPLLTGPLDAYLDGEYLLSTQIKTVPPKGAMDLGLGIEESIKVARNTTYTENWSGHILVGLNEFHHEIKIDLVNNLSKDAKIEVRERIPIPAKEAKVDIIIEAVSPPWKKYHQVERDVPIQGGYHWWVNLPAGSQKTLSVKYIVKTTTDQELIGGNRREE